MSATESGLPDYQGELKPVPVSEFRVNRHNLQALRGAADPACTQCGGRGGRVYGPVIQPCRCVLGRLSRIQRAV